MKEIEEELKKTEGNVSFVNQIENCTHRCTRYVIPVFAILRLCVFASSFLLNAVIYQYIRCSFR